MPTSVWFFRVTSISPLSVPVRVMNHFSMFSWSLQNSLKQLFSSLYPRNQWLPVSFCLLGENMVPWKSLMLIEIQCHLHIEGLGKFSNLPNLALFVPAFQKFYSVCLFSLSLDISVTSALVAPLTRSAVCCWCIVAISALEGDTVPGLPQIYSCCLAQN